MKTSFTVRSIIAAFATIAAIATAPLANADTRADKSELAQAILRALNAEGYEVRDTYHSGELEEGESTTVTTTLYKGNDYKIVVASPYQSSDVDIRVYDENGNLIAKDADTTAVGIVTLTPKWTGEFKIVITMHACARFSAGWVLQYGFAN